MQYNHLKGVKRFKRRDASRQKDERLPAPELTKILKDEWLSDECTVQKAIISYQKMLGIAKITKKIKDAIQLLSIIIITMHHE